MATRFYLPASGTPPLASLAVNTNWELTNSLARLPCYTTKQNTALATTTLLWPATSTQQWCWWQFQTNLVLTNAYDWLTTDTTSMVIGKCGETTASGDTHLAYVIRVVSGDGATIRGVIGLFHAVSTEYPLIASAATRIHSARTDGATAFSSQIGDRIIIELGLHGFTPAAENIQMRIGDPTATADFALTAGLTTDLDPWVELSRTVTLGTVYTKTGGANCVTVASGTSIKAVGGTTYTVTGGAIAICVAQAAREVIYAETATGKAVTVALGDRNVVLSRAATGTAVTVAQGAREVTYQETATTTAVTFAAGVSEKVSSGTTYTVTGGGMMVAVAQGDRQINVARAGGGIVVAFASGITGTQAPPPTDPPIPPDDIAVHGRPGKVIITLVPVHKGETRL